MFRKYFFLFLIFPAAVLFAQEEAAEEDPREGGIFPLALLLETAEEGGGVGYWQPDWPLDMPPGAFRIRGGDWKTVKVFLDGAEYRLSRNNEGLITEFPYLFRGELVQIQIGYTGVSRIANLRLVPGPAEEPLFLEVLEYNGDAPTVLREKRGSLYSFVLLSRGSGSVSETWYDDAGAALAAYEYRLTGTQYTPVSLNGVGFSPEPKTTITELRRRLDDGVMISAYHHDSRFLLTAINDAGGDYSVNYYRQDLPKYWERKPEGALAEDHYSLQWDEEGFLVRRYGVDGADDAPDGEDDFIDCRYEYSLDARGNWVECREFKMVRRFGLLSAQPGAVIRRELLYGDGEWTNP
jgi:hypothetical protein